MTAPASVVLQYPITVLTAPFTMPAVGSTVDVTVGATQWMVIGATIFVQGAGTLLVSNVTGTTTAILENPSPAVTGNVSPGTVIPIDNSVGVAPGINGPTGPSGITQTTLEASYTQPAPGTPVTIAVATSVLAAAGSFVTVAGAGSNNSPGGHYFVLSVPDGTHLTVSPTSEAGNCAQGTLIASGGAVTLSGSSGLAQDAYGNAVIPASGYSWQISPTAFGFEIGTDWGATAIAGDGQWHTIATITPAVNADEIVEMSVLVVLRNLAETPGFSRWRWFFSVQNQSGTLTEADGTQLPTLVDIKSGSSSPPSGNTQLVVSGTNILVQVQALSSFFARCAVSIDRAQAPGNPVVTAILPSFDSVGATAAVTISGAVLGRVTAAGIKIGGVKYPLTNFVLSGSTTITGNISASTPIGKGFVYVTVSSFDFVTTVPFWSLGSAPAGLVISPTSGSDIGGTALTLTASSGLTGIDAPGGGLTLKGAAATGVTYISDTDATATSGVGTAGLGNVVATTPAGSGTILNGWTYTAPPVPTLTSIGPNIARSGDIITLHGSGFTVSAPVVDFNSTPSLSVIVLSDTKATALVPSLTASATPFSVTITTLGGTTSGVNFYCAPSSLTYLWVPCPDTLVVSSSNISSWIDNSGQFAMTQGTGANQPTESTSAFSTGAVSAHFSGNQELIYSTATLPGLTVPFTQGMSVNGPASSSGDHIVISNPSGTTFFGFFNADVTAGSTSVLNDTSWTGGSHLVTCVFEATGAISIDNGTAFTGALGNNSFTSGVQVGSYGGNSLFFSGDLGMFFLADGTLSTGDAGIVHGISQAVYGTP
jgi:hypothetical protein